MSSAQCLSSGLYAEEWFGIEHLFEGRRPETYQELWDTPLGEEEHQKAHRRQGLSTSKLKLDA